MHITGQQRVAGFGECAAHNPVVTANFGAKGHFGRLVAHCGRTRFEQWNFHITAELAVIQRSLILARLQNKVDHGLAKLMFNFGQGKVAIHISTL